MRGVLFLLDLFFRHAALIGLLFTLAVVLFLGFLFVRALLRRDDWKKDEADPR